MTAVDRSFILGQLHDSRRVQDSRAAKPSENTNRQKALQAEGRSYTLSLLIDAINAGLLEQLHAEAEQALLIDVAVDQDRAWAAYRAGMASAPDTETLAFPVSYGTTEVEHIDYAEAADVREIEREMAIEAGDDSELMRQVAEDDARHERYADAALEFVPEQYIGPTGIGSSTAGGPF